MNRRETPLVIDYIILIIASVCAILHFIGLKKLWDAGRMNKVITRSMVILACVGIFALEIEWIISRSEESYSIVDYMRVVWELFVLRVFIYTYFCFRDE